MGKSFPSGMFDDKLQDIMKLLDEQGAEAFETEEAQPELVQSKDELIKELLDQDTEEVLDQNQAAFVEYSMMMKQWEALMEDYERQEAEEETARQAAEGCVD